MGPLSLNLNEDIEGKFCENCEIFCWHLCLSGIGSTSAQTRSMSTLTATTRNTTTWTTSPSTATTLPTALRRTTLPNFKIIYPRVQCADVSRKYIHSLNQRDDIWTQIPRTEDGGHHNFIIHPARNSSDVSFLFTFQPCLCRMARTRQMVHLSVLSRIL